MLGKRKGSFRENTKTFILQNWNNNILNWNSVYVEQFSWKLDIFKILDFTELF